MRKRASVANRLVAALPSRERARLLSRCERVHLSVGDELYGPAERMSYGYFPADAFVSLTIPVDGRAGVEVELVGNEGLLGVPIALGVNDSTLRATVQGAGTALRISATTLRLEIESSPTLRRTLNRYIHVLMTQLAQTTVCARFHLLDTRVASSLLMTHDRAHTHPFHLTHEFLAGVLGVRRVGVTNAAGLLQKRQLVRYSRGEITILDRDGLEAASCGCYRTAKNVYERILGAQ